jgi:hypothetical protein
MKLPRPIACSHEGNGLIARRKRDDVQGVGDAALTGDDPPSSLSRASRSTADLAPAGTVGVVAPNGGQ